MKNVIERILNLLAFLLTVGRPVTAQEIRNTVAGYDRDSDQAFERMFERDKELLRGLGIPLRLTPTDAWEVEHGYVIDPAEYALSDPGLTDDERTALWLAAQVVRVGHHQTAAEAVLKLGGSRTTSGLEGFGADLGPDESTLAEVFRAAGERRRLHFTYGGRQRTVEPHGIGHRRGHWYLVAVVGDDVRVFRIDRMAGIHAGDEPDAFIRRSDVDVGSELDAQPWETGSGRPVTVTVRFDAAVAWWAIRRLGDGPDRTRKDEDGSVEVDLVVNHLDAFVGWILGFGAEAEVLAPPEVRRRVVDRIRGVA